jgi:hypothetical protein
MAIHCRLIYLHAEVVVSNDDVAQSRVQQEGPDRFGVVVTFLPAGAARHGAGDREPPWASSRPSGRRQRRHGAGRPVSDQRLGCDQRRLHAGRGGQNRSGHREALTAEHACHSLSGCAVGRRCGLNRAPSTQPGSGVLDHRDQSGARFLRCADRLGERQTNGAWSLRGHRRHLEPVPVDARHACGSDLGGC